MSIFLDYSNAVCLSREKLVKYIVLSALCAWRMRSLDGAPPVAMRQENQARKTGPVGGGLAPHYA